MASTKTRERNQTRERTARNKKGTVKPMPVIFADVDLENSTSKFQESRSRMSMDHWQPAPVSDRTGNHSTTCADLMALAQRELSAVNRAVTGMCGFEQARLSDE